MSSFRLASLALALICTSLVTRAPARAADPSPAPAAAPIPKSQVAVTHHTAQIGGRPIAYVATAGTLPLYDDKDEQTASVFYVAYVAQGLGPTARRPITFAYNGGPGGSSALIHMGAFGPRTVATVDAGATPPAPYDLIDNANSLLPESDLVFVDAVGTGFSRIVGKGTPKDYYGIDQDGHAFAQFVRRYITANDRWNSPKFLAGESYGTTRSAVLAKMLGDAGIALSGVTLVSTVLDFATLISGKGNDEPFWMYLPSEAAVAAYHGRISPKPADVPAFLRDARTFAAGPYARALAQGDALPAGDRTAIAQQLHGYTGLPVEYLLRANLRVAPDRFEKALLADRNETVGRYDGRFTGFDLDPAGDAAETDPSSDAVFGAFTGTFNRYVRDELHYRSDAEYKFLSYDVNRQWDFKRDGRGGPVAANVGADLQQAMTANPYLRVFAANGIYDLATPFFATEYSLAHLGLAPALAANVSYGYYPAGHMIYVNPAAHAAFARDEAAFVRTASARRQTRGG